MLSPRDGNVLVAVASMMLAPATTVEACDIAHKSVDFGGFAVSTLPPPPADTEPVNLGTEISYTVNSDRDGNVFSLSEIHFHKASSAQMFADLASPFTSPGWHSSETAQSPSAAQPSASLAASQPIAPVLATQPAPSQPLNNSLLPVAIGATVAAVWGAAKLARVIVWGPGKSDAP